MTTATAAPISGVAVEFNPSILAAADRDRLALPIGKDKWHEWVHIRLDGELVENPGILVLGGSRIGKTTLQKLIAAEAASLGTIVIIIDPKQRFSKAFRRPGTHEALPHVLVYNHAEPTTAAREWAGIIELAIHDQHRRYQLDKASDDEDYLRDLALFPRVLIVVDELGRALEYADLEWNEQRKPDNHKGDTPTRNWLHESLAMGAEAGHINCWSNQTGGVNNFPKKNTESRSLFGQRCGLGNFSEDETIRAMYGTGVTVPTCPPGKKGAGNLALQRNKPYRFQAAYENNQTLYELASLGVGMLRETGHIDDTGRLYLAGVPVPRPGEMASHVTPSGLDLLHTAASPEPITGGLTDEDGDQADELANNRHDGAAAQRHDGTTETDEGEQPANDTANIAPAEAGPRFIVGNQAAAEFCGMKVDTFRTNRHRHDIPGEVAKADGNKPGWWETDLAEWALFRQQNARKDSDGGA